MQSMTQLSQLQTYQLASFHSIVFLEIVSSYFQLSSVNIPQSLYLFLDLHESSIHNHSLKHSVLVLQIQKQQAKILQSICNHSCDFAVLGPSQHH